MNEFKPYRRKQIAELRPYVDGEELNGSLERVSVSQEDALAGSPKVGDMIARNPKNHADQWLVAKQYFVDNFEPLHEQVAMSASAGAQAREEMAAREREAAANRQFRR